MIYAPQRSCERPKSFLINCRLIGQKNFVKRGITTTSSLHHTILLVWYVAEQVAPSENEILELLLDKSGKTIPTNCRGQIR
ncbi:hypothetical protein DsansV1_C01g0005171 [Dioscorea sansibarensis]